MDPKSLTYTYIPNGISSLEYQQTHEYADEAEVKDIIKMSTELVLRSSERRLS